MDGSSASASRYYRPELDVVRMLAFSFVFLHHSLPIAPNPHSLFLRGFAPFVYASAEACRFGLSLFFTLSAFLICELLLREREKTGSVGVKQFYIRRILRIWPLYYFALAVGLALAFLPGGQHAEAVAMGWYALFLGAWYSVWHGWTTSPASPLWSISVEEQFYLFAPWLVKFFSRRVLFWFCGALILLSNLTLYCLGKTAATAEETWPNTIVQFECFAAGILLCLMLHGRMPRLAHWQRLLLVLAAWGCWFGTAYWFQLHFGPNDAPGSWPLIGRYTLATLGSVLLLLAFLGLEAALLPRWAVYLGRISFGLYVFHQFAIVIANRLIMGSYATFTGTKFLLSFATSAGMTLVMASLSYRYLETPFLRIKKRHAVIESQPIQEQ